MHSYFVSNIFFDFFSKKGQQNSTRGICDLINQEFILSWRHPIMRLGLLKLHVPNFICTVSFHLPDKICLICSWPQISSCFTAVIVSLTPLCKHQLNALLNLMYRNIGVRGMRTPHSNTRANRWSIDICCIPCHVTC